MNTYQQSAVSVPEWNMRPLWNELLKLYKEFSRICKRHQLRHFVMYGSALGAVRHKGFIPWDDDFDICMPRKDYQLFFEFAKEELPPSMLSLCGDNDRGFMPTIGRVVSLENNVEDRLTRETGLKIIWPPYLDIFPLDGAPSSRLGFCWWHVRRYMLRTCEMYRFPHTIAHETWRSRVGRVLGAVFSLFYRKTGTYQSFLDLYTKLCSERSFEESKFVANYILVTLPRHFKRAWFNEVKIEKFEGLDVPVPGEIDQYLTYQYGDYMELPPLNQRRPHHQLVG